MAPPAPFVALSPKNVLLHVGVGMGAASFWRGAWYILDDHLFPNQPAWSAMSSLGMGTVGMALSQGLIHKVELLAAQASVKTATSSISSRRQLLPLKVARFGALYTIAVSCVLVWRGTWLGWVSEDVVGCLVGHTREGNHFFLFGSPWSIQCYFWSVSLIVFLFSFHICVYVIV